MLINLRYGCTSGLFNRVLVKVKMDINVMLISKLVEEKFGFFSNICSISLIYSSVICIDFISFLLFYYLRVCSFCCVHILLNWKGTFFFLLSVLLIYEKGTEIFKLEIKATILRPYFTLSHMCSNSVCCL